MLFTSAFTWFFLRTVPTSRKAKPACMASTITAPIRTKRTSPPLFMSFPLNQIGGTKQLMHQKGTSRNQGHSRKAAGSRHQQSASGRRPCLILVQAHSSGAQQAESIVAERRHHVAISTTLR